MLGACFLFVFCFFIHQVTIFLLLLPILQVIAASGVGYEFVSHFPLVLCNVFCMTIIIRDEILVPIATEGLLFSICVDVYRSIADVISLLLDRRYYSI